MVCRLIKKTSDEAARAFARRKNKQLTRAFAAVPYAERIALVPHCMRNIEKCIAREIGSYYICAECNNCKIGPISKKCRELGYKGIFVLKGGRTVEKLTAELKPRAVVGIACLFEGEQGIKQGEKHRLAVQFVALSKDGCVNTDVNLEEVLNVLKLNNSNRVIGDGVR